MLAELYNRKVKVKNKDGNGFYYELRPAVRAKTAKEKQYKNPKWVKKLVRTQQKHNKLMGYTYRMGINGIGTKETKT